MREIICIVCPNSCLMTASGQNEVSGNKCPQGRDFAVSELVNPVRTISSTVKTIFPQTPVLPVRTASEIPKGKIFDVMREINKVVIDTPLQRGDVVIKNVLGLKVDVISTSGILAPIQK